MAVVAPMPRASVSIAVKVNTGDSRICRSAYEISCRSVCMLAIYGECKRQVPGNMRCSLMDTSSRVSVDYLHKSGVDSHSMGKPSDLVQGTLDLLILKTISLEPQHGWAIAKRIQQISNEVLQVQQGSLYPALHRLEQQGWIRAAWGESENNRRAKFYSLTASGKKRLNTELRQWERLSAAIGLVVREA